MDEYIKREAIQTKLNRKKAGPANKRYTEGWNDAILMVKSMIHGEKAADVAPIRHGRWDVDGVYVVCSVCNRLTLSPIVEQLPTFKYCPNCGAKMDGECGD